MKSNLKYRYYIKVSEGWVKTEDLELWYEVFLYSGKTVNLEKGTKR